MTKFRKLAKKDIFDSIKNKRQEKTIELKNQHGVYGYKFMDGIWLIKDWTI